MHQHTMKSFGAYRRFAARWKCVKLILFIATLYLSFPKKVKFNFVELLEVCSIFDGASNKSSLAS